MTAVRHRPGIAARDIRWLLAANPGPFTLDGTRTYILGTEQVAVVDPGPDVEEHVRALLSLVEDAATVTLVLTHGHGDHAGAVNGIRERLGEVPVVGAGHPAARPLKPGEGVHTDAGVLLPVATPGHTPDHLAFHWPEARALFSGDHVLGRGDTTWVADYPGCVADYLSSLERLRELPLDVIYPGHGPPIRDPVQALDRFEAHRRGRIAAVRDALVAQPDASPDTLYRAVYGDTVPAGLESAAHRSLAALREYVDTEGSSGVSSPA